MEPPSDAVTYAELRFNDIVMQETKYDGSAPEVHFEDDMYENVGGLQPPREKRATTAPRVGRNRQLKPGLRKWSLHLSLALLLLCLLLAATVIGLAVKYVQVSSDLEQAVTSHQTISSGMAKSLRSGEELLESVRKELMATKAELEKTHQELINVVHDRMSLNSSLQQCRWDEEQSTADRQATEKTLQDTKTKLDMYGKVSDICPEGWILFGMKCFWISGEKKTWKGSKEDCESKKSKMIVVQRDDAEIKDFLKGKGEFWVGKEVKLNWEPEWKWPNGYTERWYDCLEIDGGDLRQVSCESRNKWICEKDIALINLRYSYKNLYPEFGIKNERFSCYKDRNN